MTSQQSNSPTSPSTPSNDDGDPNIPSSPSGSGAAKSDFSKYTLHSFMDLPEEMQREFIGRVDESVVEELAAADKKVMYISDLTIPVGVDIEEIHEPFSGHRLVATRNFARGETVFVNESVLLPSDLKVILRVPSSVRRIWLRPLEHSVKRGDDLREYFGFDTFQNHHCDPNTSMEYLTNTSYRQVALRDIKAGEEITNDYETFDSMADGTVFDCKCGAPQCKGQIRG